MNPLVGFFGVNPMELAIIGGIILLLFGNRLPGLMRSLGRSVVEFKHGAREIEEDRGDNAPATERAPAKPSERASAKPD